MHKKISFFFIILMITFGQILYGINITSIYDVMKERPDIKYIKCCGLQEFEYEPFFNDAFSEQWPHKGAFAESFIVKIPNGQVVSENGFIKIDDCLIAESVHQDHLDSMYLDLFFHKLVKIKPKKISGRLAVVTSGSPQCYGHWVADILGKVILLKEHEVDYDWLYVPFNKRFMKETLILLGVDPLKIIEPKGLFDFLQADELIVPSYVARRILPNNRFFEQKYLLAHYLPNWLIYYLRDLFLPLVNNKNLNLFCKKIFISRKDSGYRVVENEDEIFRLFEQRGFKRYFLSELSMIEQVALFRDAEIIAGPHGSGFSNLIYCNPGTKIIEIFQKRLDLSFFYIAQQIQFDYDYILTTSLCDGIGQKSSKISVDIIKKYLNEHPEI